MLTCFRYCEVFFDDTPRLGHHFRPRSLPLILLHLPGTLVAACAPWFSGSRFLLWGDWDAELDSRWSDRGSGACRADERRAACLGILDRTLAFFQRRLPGPPNISSVHPWFYVGGACPTGECVRDDPRRGNRARRPWYLLGFLRFDFWVLCGRKGAVGVKIFRSESEIAFLPLCESRPTQFEKLSSF